MKTCNKIAVTFFSFGMMIGTAYAQETRKEKQAASPQQQSEEELRPASYGRKMRQEGAYDGYCTEPPCSRYQRASRMSHNDRKMLRQQVDEAGKTLYQSEPR